MIIPEVVTILDIGVSSHMSKTSGSTIPEVKVYENLW